MSGYLKIIGDAIFSENATRMPMALNAMLLRRLCPDERIGQLLVSYGFAHTGLECINNFRNNEMPLILRIQQLALGVCGITISVHNLAIVVFDLYNTISYREQP